jgi:hypothetical protein
VGTPNLSHLQSQLTNTTTPGPDGQIPTNQQDSISPYERVDALVCHPAPLEQLVTLQDTSNKPANDGNDQWGVYVKPVSGFDVTPTKRTDGIGELNLHGYGGVTAGGIVFGNDIRVVDATLDAVTTDCGITLTGALKVFGEAIVTWTPSAGQSFNLATDNNGNLATPNLDASQCKAARKATKDAISQTRETNLLARAAKEYYLQNGLTPQLCREIEGKLPNRMKDSSGEPYDCSNLQNVPPVDQINILKAWDEEYKGEVGKYADFTNSLGTAHQKIQTSGTIDLFKTPHAYDLHILDQDIPIGPVTLNLAVEGYGAWNVMGGVQFGVGFSGDFSNAMDIVGGALKGQLPNIGDVRAYGGPVITPSLQTGVRAFVGVGIPGVSIGIQGDIPPAHHFSTDRHRRGSDARKLARHTAVDGHRLRWNSVPRA